MTSTATDQTLEDQSVQDQKIQDQKLQDRAAKRARVIEIMDSKGLESLLLTSHTSLSWYLDGSRVGISLAGDPIAAALVTREGDNVVAFNNEAERLAAEELPTDITLHSIQWDGSLQDVEKWYGDVTVAAEARVANELRLARRSLLPGEAGRFEILCQQAAKVLGTVLAESTPETTEQQVAAEISGRIVALGAEPLVILVNGQSRVDFRHPLPTQAPLGRRAMAVVCARKDGMIANVTRWVRFGAATASEVDGEARINAVEADTFAATTEGAAIADILAEIKESYARHGFGQNQWKLHHQGGAAGYAGRDPRATDAITDTVAMNQPFTWNPSGPGVKIEDTVLVTPNGIRPLSVDPSWPTTVVNGIARPSVLEL